MSNHQLTTGTPHGSGGQSTMTIAGVAVLVGVRVAPDQQRRIDLVVVDCGCGHQHAHRGTGIRRAPCGLKYVVAVAA